MYYYYYINNYYSLLLLMATPQEFASRDVRPRYSEDQNMEVDPPVQQVEQEEEQPRELEPEPEKPVSRYGCASE